MRFLWAIVVALGLAVEASAAVKICRSGGVDIYVDNTGVSPVSNAFQTCIDDTTVTGINLQPGTYLVDAPIVAWRAFRIGTAGLASDTRNCQQLPAGWCARFLASPSPTACINNAGYCIPGRVSSGGLLQGLGARDVIFDHLIIDGNRANRGGTQAYANCQAGSNVYGFNVKFNQCHGTSTADRCEFTYNNTKNALCGTGLEWHGDYGRVQGNAAYNNGVHQPGLWSDGLTILRNNYGMVNDNHIVNSTDVGLIVGAAYGAQIQSNWIEQNGVYAFAAMMLGNFKETGGTGQTGDYRNASIRYNTINCYGFWCGFGLNLGPDPWSPVGVDYANIFGGTVTQNNINGGRVLVNFGGAGTATHPTTVTNNTLTGAPTAPMPLKPGSPCWATPNVVQNLPNNWSTGSCGNFANADPLATSMNCYKACF
ncbi:MAG TPA: hypothetical protein VEO54_11465 [Thermoanaerobaculia bacterium]|nr:hypothetical protein [Thermoanaerobaculia bacterium]